jgi:hypothetical protein
MGFIMNKHTGWYWFDINGVKHQVELPISYNTRHIISYPDDGEITYPVNIEKKSIVADPITGQGDCRNWEVAYKTYSYDYKMLENIEEPKRKERYTFFLDIDGCIFKHAGDKPEQFNDAMEVLPGVIEFCQLCGKQGHRIVLTSGRRKSFEHITRKQLENACVSFDELILGCSNNVRVLVNDTKPYRSDNPQTAIAYNLVRDTGLQELVYFLKGNE